MLSSLSATEVAFLMTATLQAVASLVWALGAWVVAEVRRAAAHWALWALLSAVTWAVLAMHLASPPLIGIVCGVVGTMALQRGIRIFIGRPTTQAWQLALLALVVATDLATPLAEHRPVQATVNFAVLAALYFAIARDLYAHGRDDLRLRWPVVLALPVLVGATGFAARSLRALLAPESVLIEMAAHSALNVGSALSYVALVLLLHATLLALVTGRLVTNLRRLSRHDGLTGLLNRRAIAESIAAQLQRSQRSGEPFALVMLDVDHFKAINDRHGHAAGDRALKLVATLLHAELREVDRLARYGGEEFLALLPGLALAPALRVAERLRARLAASAGGFALSVSIGVSEWDGGETDPECVLARADAALYKAKAGGRNRVEAELGACPRRSMVVGHE